MSTYSILVTNNAPGCATEIEQQLTITGCTSYIVRLASNSNALGPFNIYVDDIIYYSAATRNDMFNGIVVNLECVTPTPTITPTSTATPTPTPSNGASPTPTETPTNTPTVTPTNTPTGTPGETPTATPTETATSTPTPTETPTNTPTPSVTTTGTNTPTPSVTETATPTNTPTNTETPTNTPSETATQTPTQTETPTQTPTQTPTNTASVTPTNTETPTPTPTVTATETATPTPTATETPTPTNTATVTATATETATMTPTPTNTATVTSTPTETPTNTPTVTQTQTPTMTETSTPTPTPTPTNQPLFAYLFIDRNDTTIRGALNTYMQSQGSAFRGFNLTSPSTTQSTFDAQMNAYIAYSGWTSGSEPAIITSPILPTSGGLDSYGNPILAYTFQTVQVPAATVPSTEVAWYTWMVETGSTNNLTYSTIKNGNTSSVSTELIMNSTYTSLVVNYSGSTNIPAGVYRVYTTKPSPGSNITNGGNNWYFQGGTLV